MHEGAIKNNHTKPLCQLYGVIKKIFIILMDHSYEMDILLIVQQERTKMQNQSIKLPYIYINVDNE